MVNNLPPQSLADSLRRPTSNYNNKVGSKKGELSPSLAVLEICEQTFGGTCRTSFLAFRSFFVKNYPIDFLPQGGII